MNKVHRKQFRIGAVVAVVAAVVAATAAAVDGEDDQMTITAVFTDANPLMPGNLVTAAGVEVGTIESVSLQNGLARVEMTVSDEVAPLHKDATAKIYTKDLLGERYVALDPGSPSSPELSEPAVIGPKRTARDVDLQNVLNIVDDPTGTALAGLLSALGEGAKGNGRNIAAAIKALKPAMENAGELGQLLSEQNALLTAVIDKAQPVAKAVADDRSMERLVGATTKTLSAVADNREAMRDTLRALPRTMASARERLAQVADVSDASTRTLASLRPMTGSLADTSVELRRFAAAADPALSSLPPVLAKADKMLNELGPLVRVLRPAGPELRDVAESVRTLSETALSRRLTDLMEFLKGWALATSDYDAISHYFKAVTPYSPPAASETALGPVPGAPRRPVPDVPLPGPGRLPLPGINEDPLDPQVEVPSDGSLTGLSRKQETSLVESLLGGGM